MERGSVVVVVTASEKGPCSVAGESVEKKEVLVDEKDMEKCSCVIDVNGGNEKWKEGNKEEEQVDEDMICRICHLTSDQVEFQSDLIKLGCGCKCEIGIAHVHCGETWFKLKGNSSLCKKCQCQFLRNRYNAIYRTCEICGEAATNINGIEVNHLIEEWSENSMVEASPEPYRAGGCWRGQPFYNFLMACIVIAFVLPWFFGVKMF